MLARPTPDHPQPVAHRAALRWLLVLAVALVLAQTLGLMHRVTHLTPPAAGGAHAVVQPAECSWVDALFASHESDTDCRLYDPLNHEGPPGVATQALPLVLSSFLLAWLEGDFVARRAALFQARGPPSLR